MKKILYITTLITFILSNSLFLKETKASSSNETYFVVSAYYSPLPNQRYYLKGNYEDEIRLNGKGVRGASGKGVFSGMIAAPKNYRFGTKIYLEGLGIGSVEDRGGAIVNAGVRGYSYDRLDVWMGYGEEGLKRALAWGKRTVKGSFVNKDIATNINIKKLVAPDYAVKRLTKQNNIFTKGIGIKSSTSDIKALQTFLKEVGIYNGEVTGKYDTKMIDTVYDYQKKYGLIKTERQYGTGYWGKSTRSLALQQYYKGELTKKTITNSNPTYSIFNKNIGPESNKEDIKKVQSIFQEMGLFNSEISGNYKDIENILISYQIKNGLIKHKSNRGAGYFGPKTRVQLKKDYLSYKAKTEEKRKKEEIEEKNKKESQVKLAKIKKEVENKVNKHLTSIGQPSYGHISPGVRELQKTLKILGYFNVKDSAIFGPVTKESILKYQLDKGIIKHKADKGAGHFGPTTKENIKKDLITMLIQRKVKEENLVVYKN